MKKVLMFLLCGLLFFCLVGCGDAKKEESSSDTEKTEEKIKDKEQDVKKEDKEKEDDKKDETEKKENYTQMICNGKPRSDSSVYKSIKNFEVKWVVSFHEMKTISNIYGTYTMSFDEDVDASILEENDELLNKRYCETYLKDETFDSCSTNIMGNKIYMDVNFYLDRIDDSELRDVAKDPDMFPSLLAVNLDGIKDYTCSLK